MMTGEMMYLVAQSNALQAGCIPWPNWCNLTAVERLKWIEKGIQADKERNEAYDDEA